MEHRRADKRVTRSFVTYAHPRYLEFAFPPIGVEEVNVAKKPETPKGHARSAIDGRFVPITYAQRHKKTTVIESPTQGKRGSGKKN